MALDAKTGTMFWRTERPTFAASFGTPAIAELSSRRYLIVSGGRRLSAYDVESGREIAYAPLPMTEIVPSVLVDGEHCYISGEGRVFRFDFDGTQFKKVWMTADEVNVVSSPILANGNLMLFTQDGEYVVLDSEDGAVRLTTELDGRFFSSPVMLGNLVLCGTELGEVYAIDANTKKVVGRISLHGRLMASPAVYKDRILLRSDKGLFCFRVTG